MKGAGSVRTRRAQCTHRLNERGRSALLPALQLAAVMATSAGLADEARAEATKPAPCKTARKRAWVRSIDGYDLQAAPDRAARGAGRLAYGNQIEILDCSNNGARAFKVRAGKLSGWVLEEYLSLEPVPSPADPMVKAGAALLVALKTRRPLGSLLEADGVLFVYSGDDRVDGSTTGQVQLKAGAELDKPFKLRVVSDGKGWETPKQEQRRKVKDLTVSFANWLKEWIGEVHFPEFDLKRRTMSIADPASQSVTVRFKRQRDGSERVDRIEYSSEDPG
jgi:hypothetical protein